MPKAPEGYQPLLNRGANGSLWLADDHVLVIETTRFLLCIRETYRRLDFSNIQAVLHAKSQRGTWLIVLFVLLLCASLGILALSGFDSRPAQIAAGFMALPTLIALVVHFMKGQTSSLTIQTTVCPWRLKMVTRHSHALKVIAALEPLCRQAQQDILADAPDRPATSAFKPIPAIPPLPADSPPPVAGVHPLTVPAWLCHLAFAAMMAGEMLWNSIAATLLMMGFAAATFTLLMIAFTRGGGSLATGGRGVFIFGLSTLGLCLLAGYAATMSEVFQSSIRGDESEMAAEQMMLRALARFPEGNPGAVSMVAVSIIALTGFSALAGLFASSQRIKLHRSSREASTPPSP